MSRKRTCLCNECKFGSGEPIQDKISLDTETFCGIGAGEDGEFRASYLMPEFGVPGTVCWRLAAFQASMEAQKAARMAA